MKLIAAKNFINKSTTASTHNTQLQATPPLKAQSVFTPFTIWIRKFNMLLVYVDNY